MAFALALSKVESPSRLEAVNFTALIGLDPVASHSMFIRNKPAVINTETQLLIPATVIGTGLGRLMRLCAPPWLNYKAFYGKCTKPPYGYFVMHNYDHMDMDIIVNYRSIAEPVELNPARFVHA